MKLLRILAAERIPEHDDATALLRRLLAQLDTALAPTPPAFDAGTSRDVLERKTSVSVTYTQAFPPECAPIPLED